MYLNKFIGIGNCAADPEVKDIQGRRVANFRIGITERFKDANGQVQDHTEWVNVVAWAKVAEIAERFVQRGTPVLVEGKIQSRQWEDRQGNKRFVTEINATNIQVLNRATRQGGRQRPADDEEF